MRYRSILVLPFLLGPLACSKGAGPTADPGTAAEPPPATAEAEAPVVLNAEAQPGDRTTCPYSGRAFVVKAEHPRVEYQGQQYWICSEKAAEAVRADPDQYLAEFEG